MRPDHRPEAHIIVQASKTDKFPHVFLISASRFPVRDVRQPFVFGRNIGEKGIFLKPRARRRNTARLWDLSAKDPAANPVVLRGHDGPVNAVAISQDNHWLVTGSYNGSLDNAVRCGI
jgi:WD domain, G-beta repeat